ncbi:hypothetical protein FHETE_10120 [Fusarium heterosporum]|uniref:Myb-like domain-containing protein n=1 Tax=Fusarium heterosporum TaxID=42747 RepID=A0A8H5WH43_FUSHE|nr:hypothetical protein FHETE_10120 [Fusarium heterosporum]
MTDPQSPLPGRIKKEEPPNGNSNLNLFSEQEEDYLSDRKDKNGWKYEQDLTDDESWEENKDEPSDFEIEDNNPEAEASRASLRNLATTPGDVLLPYPIRGGSAVSLPQDISTQSPSSDTPRSGSILEHFDPRSRHRTYTSSGDSEVTYNGDDEIVPSASSENYTEGSGDVQAKIESTGQDVLLPNDSVPNPLVLSTEDQLLNVVIRSIKECEETYGNSDDFTEFELRCHHNERHRWVQSIDEFVPWSLDEELALLKSGHKNRGEWEEAKDELPGRKPEDCKRRYKSIKPKGYEEFDVKISRGTSNQMIYRGIFHCCYLITKPLAMKWVKMFPGISADWPTGVRKIIGEDMNLTQNELTILLTHLLTMAVNCDLAARNIGEGAQKLLDGAIKMANSESNQGSPSSMAATEALKMLSDLVEWEMKADEDPLFHLTIKVQCGEGSRLHGILKVCFQSESTSKNCDEAKGQGVEKVVGNNSTLEDDIFDYVTALDDINKHKWKSLALEAAMLIRENKIYHYKSAKPPAWPDNVPWTEAWTKKRESPKDCIRLFARHIAECVRKRKLSDAKDFIVDNMPGERREEVRTKMISGIQRIVSKHTTKDSRSEAVESSNHDASGRKRAREESMDGGQNKRRRHLISIQNTSPEYEEKKEALRVLSTCIPVILRGAGVTDERMMSPASELEGEETHSGQLEKILEVFHRLKEDLSEGPVEG